MPLSVRCESPASYDPATNSYLPCGTVFQVPDDQAGRTVECPSCGEAVRVPVKSTAGEPRDLATDRGRTAPTESRPAASQSALSPRTEAARSESPPTAPSRSESRSTPESNSGGTGSVSPPNSPVVSPVVSSTAPLSHSAADRALPDDAVASAAVSSAAARRLASTAGVPCRGCGMLFPPFVPNCPSCGQPRKANWNDVPLAQYPIEPAGFQLSARRLLGNQVSIEQVLLMVVAAFGVIGFALIVIAAGHPLSLGIVGGSVAIVVLGSLEFLRQSRRIGRVPGAPLVFWQRFLWRAIGSAVMAGGWTWRGKRWSTERLVIRDRAFGDAELLQIAELNRLQVLVLRDTAITDQSLRYLRGLRQLRYLHLEGTSVSDEQVFRLQQTIPSCWIWW